MAAGASIVRLNKISPAIAGTMKKSVSETRTQTQEKSFTFRGKENSATQKHRIATIGGLTRTSKQKPSTSLWLGRVLGKNKPLSITKPSPTGERKSDRNKSSVTMIRETPLP